MRSSMTSNRVQPPRLRLDGRLDASGSGGERRPSVRASCMCLQAGARTCGRPLAPARAYAQERVNGGLTVGRRKTNQGVKMTIDLSKRNWAFVKEHMPRTVAMLKEYRELGEGAHVDECWQQGVLNGLPNWFFAKEGPLTLGTPFDPLPPTSTRGALEQCELARTGTLLLLAPVGTDLNVARRRKRLTGSI